LAAILTKVYNLADVYSTDYMLWYIREASVAVCVTNVPLIWPLLREWFSFLRQLSIVRTSDLPYYNASGPNSHDASRRASVPIEKHVQEVREMHNMKVQTPTMVERSAESDSSSSYTNEKHRRSSRAPSLEIADLPAYSSLRTLDLAFLRPKRERRHESPESDECVLCAQNFIQWGKGDIRTEITVDIEREGFHAKREAKYEKIERWLSKHSNTNSEGESQWNTRLRDGNTVEIEGGRNKKGFFSSRPSRSAGEE